MARGSLELLCRLQSRISDCRYPKRSRSADLHERRHRATTSNMAIARPTGNFMGLLCCLRAARWLGAITSIPVEAAGRARPAQWSSGSDAADKLEIPVGHAFFRWTTGLYASRAKGGCCGQRRKPADHRGRR